MFLYLTQGAVTTKRMIRCPKAYLRIRTVHRVSWSSGGSLCSQLSWYCAWSFLIPCAIVASIPFLSLCAFWRSVPMLTSLSGCWQPSVWPYTCPQLWWVSPFWLLVQQCPRRFPVWSRSETVRGTKVNQVGTIANLILSFPLQQVRTASEFLTRWAPTLWRFCCRWACRGSSRIAWTMAPGRSSRWALRALSTTLSYWYYRPLRCSSYSAAAVIGWPSEWAWLCSRSTRCSLCCRSWLRWMCSSRWSAVAKNSLVLVLVMHWF